MNVFQWTGWIFLIEVTLAAAVELEDAGAKILPLDSFLSNTEVYENATGHKIEENNSTERFPLDYVSELMTALLNTRDTFSDGTISINEVSEESPTTLSTAINQDSSGTSETNIFATNSNLNKSDEMSESSTLSKVLYYDESVSTEFAVERDINDSTDPPSVENVDESTISEKLETAINQRNPFDVIVIDEEATTRILPYISSERDEIAESESKLTLITPSPKPLQSEKELALSETDINPETFDDSKKNSEDLDEDEKASGLENQTTIKREPKFADTFFRSSLGNDSSSVKGGEYNNKVHFGSNRNYPSSNLDPNRDSHDVTDLQFESVEVFSDPPISFDDGDRNLKNPQNEKTTGFVFSSVRQIHPESNRPSMNYDRRPDLIDRVRPLHPDPVGQFSYFRPTPDSRIPVVKEETDSSRSRPDSNYQRASFKPSSGQSKSTQSGSTFIKYTGGTTTKPPRVSYKPYQSQSSFGRPYRPPTYQKPSSTTPEESPSSSFDIRGASKQGYDASEISRADYDFSKPSSSFPYSKNFPTFDTSKPSVIYPKPSFVSNYQPSGAAASPFAAGAVVGSKNITKVEFIKADCFNNHMKVTMRFNGSFTGLVYSSGYAQDNSCNYVNGSGRDSYDFFIRLNRCGTIGKQEVPRDRLNHDLSVRDERAQYLVNTITVQYNPVIEEDIDEHFKVTCEYGYDFWKTVTFPMINVESSISKSPSLKIRTGSPVVFTLPPPQCNMEIRRGYGLTGPRVTGPVSVGDPLTLVIHMKSESPGFDILVSNCFAHNGAQKRLQLLNSDGCVVENQIVTDFRGVKTPDRRQQVTLYSYLKAFRFTGSPALYIECDVHMCHGTCPSQRCHWRKLFKRSLESNSTAAADSLVSDSVSLFQALEVRHEDADQPDLLPLRHSGRIVADDLLCLKTGGFAALLACFLLLFVISTASAVCMCLRLRKMKRLTQEPDTKHFVELSGNMSFS